MTMTAEQLVQLREEVSNPAIGGKDHLRKLSLALLDELEAKDRRIDILRQDKDKVIDMSKERIGKLLARIAELEEQLRREQDYHISVDLERMELWKKLEARTVTVKLPGRCECCYSDSEAALFDGVQSECVESFKSACAAAGINLTVEG
ncbi:hypothetical protein [Atlantibacter hermannii]|uniref:hypothetical protein n=1 Tax=Atlantibacter hermannii TaxID=565 RepID=UPI0034D66818